MAFFIPVMGGDFLVGCFELLVLSVLGKLPLQIGDIGDRAAKAQGVVEHLQENIHDGILIGFSIRFALGVNIEDDHIGGCIGGQLHIRQNHRIGNLLVVDEKVDGVLVTDDFIVQDVG